MSKHRRHLSLVFFVCVTVVAIALKQSSILALKPTFHPSSFSPCFQVNVNLVNDFDAILEQQNNFGAKYTAYFMICLEYEAHTDKARQETV